MLWKFPSCLLSLDPFTLLCVLYSLRTLSYDSLTFRLPRGFSNIVGISYRRLFTSGPRFGGHSIPLSRARAALWKCCVTANWLVSFSCVSLAALGVAVWLRPMTARPLRLRPRLQAHPPATCMKLLDPEEHPTASLGPSTGTHSEHSRNTC